MGDGPSRDSRYMWKGWSQDKYLEGQAVGEVRGASGRAPGGTEAEAQLCGQPGVETVDKAERVNSPFHIFLFYSSLQLI